jgi:hypothetical protein
MGPSAPDDGPCDGGSVGTGDRTARWSWRSPSLSSIYRALAEHEKAQAYPEAVETAHADFAALQQRDRSPK